MTRTLLIFTLLLLSIVVAAQVRLPQLISDGMVLQRDQLITIYGWASPGENIRVSFTGRTQKTVTDGSGRWSVHFPARPACGPFTIKINDDITIRDILIGDVYFCSGQSNMVLPMERVKEKYPEEIAGADFPQIRNFFVPTASDVQKIHEDLPASKWVATSPQTILRFGAASWFFAKQLYQRYHIPIGIINSSVGGTPIQAWISAEGLKDVPPYADKVAQFTDTSWHLPVSVAPPSPAITDEGLAGAVKWYAPEYIPEGWRPFWLPGYWADQGVKGLNGIVWFRKEVDVPASMAGKPAKLFVGRIIDADETYVNGVEVGNITYQYPPRRYDIPAGVLKAGKNLLVIRVMNYNGKGGFVPDKRYELTDGVTSIDIRGDWQYKVGAVYPVAPPSKPPFSARNEPTGLYNTMVAPAIHTAIKGFLWYQGEANAANPGDYKALLPALINDWRNKWGNQDLPFLYVQLPNFMEMQYAPSESNWAVIREAQLLTLSVPHTAMAVTIDVGEWNDIHPLNKKDVGERLALAARTVIYGETGLEYSGPIFRSMERQGDSVLLRFTHIGGGLVAKGGPLKGFAVAGPDKHFIWAAATILDTIVILHSDKVIDPIAVRYAWADNPDANLYNREGLPASPFRTDIQHMTAEEDHRRMMQLLHIDSLRPGPSGNPKAPNAANTDESKATTYTSLPDPLILNNGKKVTTPSIWWQQRRPEIVEDFDREMYGRTPDHIPAVHWDLVSMVNDTIGGIPVITKKLIGSVDNSAYPAIAVNIDLTLSIPAAAKGPVPVMLELGFKWPPGMRLPDPPPGPKLPTGQELVIAKGWGFAVIYPTSIQPDNGAGLTDGIIGLVNKGLQRKPDDWGALKAWAWGCSRALDYFESDPAVDAKQVGIEGLSRYGKATAVAMAYEPRFAVGFIGSSGEGGVKIHRRHFGEQVENVASAFEYHWMAGNFIKYAGPLTPNDLPVDAHELVALCAPRPVFISAGSPQVEGNWVDAKGMFLGGAGAGPVYRLLGKKGLGTMEFPPMETALVDGDIAWRQHSGGHTTGPNWPAFLQWASRYIKTKAH